MFGVLAAGPVALFVIAAVVLGAVLAVTAVRRRHLAPVVADARQHGVSSGAVALAAGLVVAAVVVVADAARLLGSGVSVALAPLAFGVVHTAVLGVGERVWPRPGGALRTASLTPRRFPSSLRWLRATCGAAAGLVVVTCVGGWLSAGPDGRSFTSSRPSPPGVDGLVGPSTTGPYPGVVFALPALVGTVVLLLLTVVAVRVAMSRPAVPADEQAERVLRTASVHRVLRGTTSALLLLLAGLWGVAGAALRTAAQDTVVGVNAVTYIVDGPRGLEAFGGVVMLGGLLAGCAALGLLLVPAVRLQPAPPTAQASPVQA